MNNQLIYILVGTRPNFIKVTRFKELAEKYGKTVKIIHTGQHFDENMANVFFKQFELEPDYFLEVGGLSPNSQIGEIILRLEKLFETIGRPDYFMVPGDVNSTLAGAIAANKMGIKLVHLESGLRSKDQLMPEEHNRILTDYLADVCFVTEQSGLDNLEAEESLSKVHYVGNTMIDTLVHFEPKIEASTILEELQMVNQNYVLATFHRPSNVDTKEKLEKLLEILKTITSYQKLILPLHPRTLKMFKTFDLYEQLGKLENLVLTTPLGYFEFQKLIKYSKLVITDSGGIQEETTYRQVPCLTLRENTERPITITEGTNTLVKFTSKDIAHYLQEVLSGSYKRGSVPKYWDGKASERILSIL
ncbi:MAG: UDP-N-acetylglucosamine 2-epimerase (non-hydrolyzing) [Flavobacteriales bacterium]|jgi:UDP-N-acetylglucosamine 2-epimerase (non-hydrolysing)|nr:UDP-N-acetylglucosamine 2-epimerase (non-hydrolyzing) [Flavobacteriales bacterium]